MALQFVTKLCGCGNTFKTSNDSDKCYNCALEDITNGNPPEEGDFNTAAIVSGTMTEIERGYLQQDLESVELGRTTDEAYEEDYYLEEDDDDDDYYLEEDDDDDWEYDENQAARYGDVG